MACFLLNKILQDAGRSLADFEMRTAQRDLTAAVENPLVAEQLDYKGASTRDRELRAMNPEQQSAFNKVVESVEQQLGKVFFLSGAASSSIAALLLRGERTAHSVFKIPIDGLNDESTCSIPEESLRAGASLP
ncbi:hypothetical protein B0H13DRAFT_2305592 [Mycena leptocephala]|nr:hypothetical protein B0H13DRAFT_2341059 [Mycena leptocephala]KAJ7934491.1 hypothetical protein B0H13DRAFT_2305592 [Mycena leptocephala]